MRISEDTFLYKSKHTGTCHSKILETHTFSHTRNRCSENELFVNQMMPGYLCTQIKLL